MLTSEQPACHFVRPVHLKPADNFRLKAEATRMDDSAGRRRHWEDEFIEQHRMQAHVRRFDDARDVTD